MFAVSSVKQLHLNLSQLALTVNANHDFKKIFSFLQSESVLEYQNKALATLLRTQKRKVAELTAKLDKSAAERASLESTLATLSNELIKVSQLPKLSLLAH